MSWRDGLVRFFFIFFPLSRIGFAETDYPHIATALCENHRVQSFIYESKGTISGFAVKFTLILPDYGAAPVHIIDAVKIQAALLYIGLVFGLIIGNLHVIIVTTNITRIKIIMNQNRIMQALLRGDMASFAARAFATVNPGAVLVPNWHIDLISEALMSCTRREITRLIINMPPRMLKSQMVSVAWPAWMLGRNPAERIIAASYSSALAIKHSMDSRRLLQSDWYQNLFPWTRLLDGQNERHRFSTSALGYRLATSVGGTLTGDGGNFLILDDPLNPRQAASTRIRNQVNNWVGQTFLSRLDDKKNGVVVLVMQRLHEDDVTGFLLRQHGARWKLLTLPAIAENDMEIAIGNQSWQMKRGDVLQKEREDAAVLTGLRAEIGSRVFAAQYQQSPVAEGDSGFFRRSWWRRYRIAPEGMVVHSWDTAIKTGQEHDYSVATIWCFSEDGKAYLLHLWRDKVEYPELRRQVLALAEQFPPTAVLLEDKGSGQGLLQELRRSSRLPLIGINPRDDKVTRAAQASVMAEGGRVYLPEEALWLADFEHELASFPAASHDDQADSMAQALIWWRNRDLNARLRSV